MISLPPSLQQLIAELSKLPSIGEKSATRLAYHLVTQGKALSSSLAASLGAAATRVRLCEHCFFLAEDQLCTICKDNSRDRRVVCVVEKPMDLLAIERVGEYRGTYHVLHGLWAPLRGLSKESIRIAELFSRVEAGGIQEVIIATSATVEGDATALYLAHALTEKKVRSTRLAQGMPKGGGT